MRDAGLRTRMMRNTEVVCTGKMSKSKKLMTNQSTNDKNIEHRTSNIEHRMGDGESRTRTRTTTRTKTEHPEGWTPCGEGPNIEHRTPNIEHRMGKMDPGLCSEGF